MNIRHLLLIACSLALVPGLLQAHHSFSAQYDRNAPVSLQGTVTRVVWANPHAHFYLDVVDEDGSTANWDLELASPNMLIRNGWKRDSLKQDDRVQVSASRARDGTNTAAVTLITREDGSELTFISGNDQ